MRYIDKYFNSVNDILSTLKVLGVY